MKKFLYVLSFLIFVFSLISCEEAADNPIPVISALSTNWSVTHSPDFKLVITGRNFVNGAQVVFNNSAISATVTNSTELACTIEPNHTLLLTSGSEGLMPGNLGDGTVQVIVRNPAPGGGDSNVLSFNILSNQQFKVPALLKQNCWQGDNPVITRDSTGILYLVYDERISTDSVEIFIKTSRDNGNTWTSGSQVTPTSDLSVVGNLAADSSGRLYLFWMEWLAADDGYDIYYSMSDDRGSTWSSPVNISQTPGYSGGFSVVIDNAGGINLMWIEEVSDTGPYYQMFTRSTDRGQSWSSASIAAETGCYYSPYLTADSAGNLYAIWRYGACIDNGEIYFSKSTDHGATWSTQMNISNTPANESSMSSLAVSPSGTIHIEWSEQNGGYWNVFYTKSSDGGNSWGTPANLTNTTNRQNFGEILADSAGNVNLIRWEIIPGSSANLYYNRSINEGTSWGTPLLVTTISFSNNLNIYFNSFLDTAGTIYSVWTLGMIADYSDLYFTRMLIPGVD